MMLVLEFTHVLANMLIDCSIRAAVQDPEKHGAFECAEAGLSYACIVFAELVRRSIPHTFKCKVSHRD